MYNRLDILIFLCYDINVKLILHPKKEFFMKNKVKELRVQKDMTQISFAEALGVTRQTVISIESEKREPSLSLAFNISKVLKEPIENIFIPQADE